MLNDCNNNNPGSSPPKKTSSRVTYTEVQRAENEFDERLMSVAGTSDEFHAVYWPMEKWLDDRAVVEMLSAMVSAYPGLNWNNPPSMQFASMLSVVQNVDWMNELRNSYEFGMVDFMRIVFMNWPELFSRKKYVSTLSSTIVSALTEKGQL